MHLKNRHALFSTVSFRADTEKHPTRKRSAGVLAIKFFMGLLLCFLALTTGCTTETNLKTPDPRQHLLDNLSSDLAEINLIAENARKEFQTEILEIRILDAWSLAKEKQFQKIGGSQAKVITVLQTSIIEITTLKKSVVVEISKIQGGDSRFFGVDRPESEGEFYTQAPLLAEVGGYEIRLYDATLDLDDDAVNAIKRYVMMIARFEKTAKIIFKKMLELEEKYRDSAVAIESFNIMLPSITIDMHFRIK